MYELLKLGCQLAYHVSAESVGIGTTLTVIHVNPRLHPVCSHQCRFLLPFRRCPIITQSPPVSGLQPIWWEWLPSLWVIALCQRSYILSESCKDVGVSTPRNSVKYLAATVSFLIRVGPSVLHL